MVNEEDLERSTREKLGNMSVKNGDVPKLKKSDLKKI